VVEPLARNPRPFLLPGRPQVSFVEDQQGSFLATNEKGSVEKLRESSWNMKDRVAYSGTFPFFFSCSCTIFAGLAIPPSSRGTSYTEAAAGKEINK